MIHVTKLTPGGQALGTLDDPASPDHGKKVFLWNALPGETVTAFDLTKRKSSYLEGIATEIEHPSPHRVTPRDSLYLSTSPWQIFDWDYELAQKCALVAESLRQAHIPLDGLDISPVQTDGKEWHYRNKMEYALYWDNSDNCIYLAFRARGTHKKQKVLTSSLERPELLQAALECVRDLNNRHEEARKYQSLLLRCNQHGEVSGGLLENHRPHPVFPNLRDTLLGHEYSYSPNGFFQINLPVYELALQEIRKHITTSDVLDLYSGVGTIGLSVARDKKLVLVESDKSAFKELVKNCEEVCGEECFFSGPSAGQRAEEEEALARNDGPRELRVPKGTSDRKQTLAILAKSEDVTDFIQPGQTVILDPPRAGCDAKLIERLNAVQPETIIYLSCNPSTQARDVALLLQHYRIAKIVPFNFFPKTPHIENLIILSRLP
ncbi:class I SAM-dependent RNA methyltransferase [Candidatus Saccharibacteria bacterium]|nr:class I SAM-dependent RNA methyltransferase [Candidatus Saccharibacteria bacterium]